MTDKPILLRGRTLSFVAEPKAADDCDAYQYCEDGAILVQDGSGGEEALPHQSQVRHN